MLYIFRQNTLKQYGEREHLSLQEMRTVWLPCILPLLVNHPCCCLRPHHPLHTPASVCQVLAYLLAPQCARPHLHLLSPLHLHHPPRSRLCLRKDLHWMMMKQLRNPALMKKYYIEKVILVSVIVYLLACVNYKM